MKHITLLSLIFAAIYTLNAQTTNNDCWDATSQVDLDVNNVRAGMLGGGSMWWDLSNGRYIVPNVEPGEKEVSSIFAAGLWIGGYDAAGNLKLAAQTYRQIGNDFWAGPIPESGSLANESCLTWDRHWRINKSEIDAHIADFQDNGQIDNPIPSHILIWPGRNNPEFNALPGTDLPDRPFAPFVDVDGDGIYQAAAGDYPEIKGDQAIWWMFNDTGNIHSQSGGDQLGVEVAVMAYAYNSVSSEAFNNTTFYEYTITNKSTVTHFDLYVGLFVDIGLGCSNNDYVGCDTSRNLAYGYNGEATDPDCGNTNGYGEEIPLIGIRILDGLDDEMGNPQGMSGFMHYYNNFSLPNSNPQEAQDYYNYMTGFWKDDTPIQYGGDGYQEGTSPTSYMYPSNPSDTSPGAWSECSVENTPGDRRVVISTGPGTLESGESDHITYAVTWVPDVPHPCPDLTPLQNASDVIANVYQTITSPQEVSEIEASITLHPNPMTTTSMLRIESELSVESVQIYSADGRLQRTYENADNQVIIERNNLSTGIYFYEIKFKNGQMKGGKLVMQ